MQFRDVQPNYPVFILDKQELTVKQGKVVTKGFPHPDLTSITSPSKTFIDFGIELDGKTAVYTIPDDLSVTYAGNLVLSPDKTNIINEIEAIKNTAEQIINSVDAQKEKYEKASALLAELNPVYRDKKETENRLTKLEGSIDDIKSMMSKLMESLGGK